MLASASWHHATPPLLDPPCHPHAQVDVLSRANIAFTIIFACECAAKVLAFGFLAYIKSWVNALDFVVVITSVLELVLGNLPWFHALRALRALKPLMRSEGMRQVGGGEGRHGGCTAILIP